MSVVRVKASLPWPVILAAALCLLTGCAQAVVQNDSYTVNIQLLPYSLVQNPPSLSDPAAYADAPNQPYWASVVVYRNLDAVTSAKVVVDNKTISYSSDQDAYYDELPNSYSAGKVIGISVSYSGMNTVNINAIIPSVSSAFPTYYTINNSPSSSYSFTATNTVSIVPVVSNYGVSSASSYNNALIVGSSLSATINQSQKSFKAELSPNKAAVFVPTDLDITTSTQSYAPTSVSFSGWPENKSSADVSSTTSYVLRVYATAGVRIYSNYP